MSLGRGTGGGSDVFRPNSPGNFMSGQAKGGGGGIAQALSMGAPVGGPHFNDFSEPGVAPEAPGLGPAPASPGFQYPQAPAPDLAPVGFPQAPSTPPIWPGLAMNLAGPVPPELTEEELLRLGRFPR